MRLPTRAGLGLAAATIAAMAVGQVIVDTLPVAGLDGAAAPFFTDGVVGKSVPLSFADVEVVHAVPAARVQGNDVAVSVGKFVVIDLKVLARHKSETFLGIAAVDTNGRHYLPTSRGTSCSTSVTAPAGVPWYSRICIEVPKSRLKGLKIEVARGAPSQDRAAQRRDDVAVIDLDLDKAKAAEWSANDEGYPSKASGMDPITLKALLPPKESG